MPQELQRSANIFLHTRLCCAESFRFVEVRRRVFVSGRYNVEEDEVVVNPNDYFDKAMALAEEKNKQTSGGSSASGTPPARPPAALGR